MERLKSTKLDNLGLKILIVCSLGLFIDGFDLYISSVTEPFIKQQFHLSSLAVGMVQAAAPIGAAFGAIFIGRIIDSIGRRTMLMLNIIFFIVAAILSGLAVNIQSLIFFRFLVGFGVGADYPVCAVYLSEMVSRYSRGKKAAIAMFINCLASPVGVFIAYLIFLIYPNINAWRYMFMFGAVPAVIALFFRKGLPESFMWKVQKDLKRDKKEKTSFKDIFSKKYIRITLVVSMCWFLMDISYYGLGLFTPEILGALKFSKNLNFLNSARQIVLSTLFLNISIVIGAFIAIFIIDKYGRLVIQKLGFFVSFVALFILGMSKLFNNNVNIILIFTCFFVFNIFINLGPDITTYLLPSEIYPTELRGTGHGFSSGFAKIGAFIGAMFLPVLQSLFGISITVIIISFTLLAGFLLTYLIPVETKNVNLEDIE